MNPSYYNHPYGGMPSHLQPDASPVKPLRYKRRNSMGTAPGLQQYTIPESSGGDFLDSCSSERTTRGEMMQMHMKQVIQAEMQYMEHPGAAADGSTHNNKKDNNTEAHRAQYQQDPNHRQPQYLPNSYDCPLLFKEKKLRNPQEASPLKNEQQRRMKNLRKFGSTPNPTRVDEHHNFPEHRMSWDPYQQQQQQVHPYYQNWNPANSHLQQYHQSQQMHFQAPAGFEKHNPWSFYPPLHAGRADPRFMYPTATFMHQYPHHASGFYSCVPFDQPPRGGGGGGGFTRDNRHGPSTTSRQQDDFLDTSARSFRTDGGDSKSAISGSKSSVVRDQRKQNHASIQRQIQLLSKHDRECFESIKERWQESYPDFDYNDDMYLRFARATADTKTGEFCEDKAWKSMRSFNKRYLSLRARRLEKQLSTKTLFPVPGLKSRRGHDVFYMKPARYYPRKTRTRAIIDNLAYVMNCMQEKPNASKDGIAFVANMDNWAMKNFDIKYCYMFMLTLQGHTVPVRVQLFLIVNPPSWFGRIWRLMKPMLAPTFRKKVKMIREEELSTYLHKGYEEFLPDDMKTGRADTEAIVNDFIRERKQLEKLLYGRHDYNEFDTTEQLDDDDDSVPDDLLSVSKYGSECADPITQIEDIVTGEEGTDPLGLEEDILAFLKQNDAITEYARPYDYDLDYYGIQR